VEKSVLVVPGDHFGMDGYLRFGFGDIPDRLRGALDRVSEGLIHCGLRIADPIGSLGKAKG
jgi:aspartate/methionine/tyrosine aminotransferase